jgi:hypothetical protein
VLELVPTAAALTFKILPTRRRSISFTEGIAGHCIYPSGEGQGISSWIWFQFWVLVNLYSADDYFPQLLIYVTVCRTPRSKCYMTSRDALPLAKQWMRRCCNTHRLCNAPTTNRLPTRLVCAHDTDPYLWVTMVIETESEYATVSNS